MPATPKRRPCKATNRRGSAEIKSVSAMSARANVKCGTVSATRRARPSAFDMEVVQTWATADMVALATIERTNVEVGGLPAQDWALRVTLVYRREGSEWRLAHRHADPFVAPVSVEQAAAIARGERATPKEFPERRR